MSVGYVAVQWNRHKRIYDLITAGAMVVFVATFFVVGRLAFAGEHAVSDPILLMRALGACAFISLHVILCIGPLARLNSRFTPFLYNRRHLGVATFLVGVVHAVVAVGFYHGFGIVNPLVSLLGTNTAFLSFATFPYQLLGVGGLLILFLMAATSHDFWLRNLGARTWKRLHMLVYLAYLLLVMHVALGALQTQRSGWLIGIVALGAAIVGVLHVVAGFREHFKDVRGVEEPTRRGEGWIDVCSVDEIADGRGKPVAIGERERIAIFRYGNCVSATTNVCAHQGGPLGEGKIIDGCVTCPWHGWTYRPGDGQAPPPFTEKIATYRVRVVRRRVQVNPEPLPPGTPVEPAQIEPPAPDGGTATVGEPRHD